MFLIVSFDATPRPPYTKIPLRRFARRIRADPPAGYAGPPPTYTLFFNTSLLQLKKKWRPRRRSRWASEPESSWRRFLADPDVRTSNVVPYARDPDAIAGSAQALKELHAAGVELASHTVRHFKGRRWTYAQWKAEFADHQRILDMHGLPKPRGFRAPFLSTGKRGRAVPEQALFRVMVEYGMVFDSSKVYGAEVGWPHRIGDTRIWEAWNPMIRRKGGSAQLFFGWSGTHNTYAFYFRALAEFKRRYHGNRAPLLLGGHGEHMRSIGRLMRKVCYWPKVRCATYSEMVDYMEAHPDLSGYAGR